MSLAPPSVPLAPKCEICAMSHFYTERTSGVIWCKKHSNEAIATARFDYLMSLKTPK